MRRASAIIAVCWLAAGLIGPCGEAPAWAGAVEFSAQVDRNRVTQEESVALKFSVRAEGNLSMERPSFNAPDFDVVNEYSGTFIESYYENGRFGVRNKQELTKVLRPRRTGELKIDGIEVRVGGQAYSAPPIVVRVDAAGAGTPPPRGYGGGGVGLRGAGKRPRGAGYFLRAEVDKDKVFKGEQVIVSYYLYTRVRTFNIQVTKYPTLNGFLREDLEMPIVGGRMDREVVVLDGTAYERSLLVRYAAYPLKDGKLTIDPMALKLNYYGTELSLGNEEDPFMNFFQQLAPRNGDAKSEPLSIEVEALPESNRPAGFSGAVGEFEIVAAADKTEVRANEAITLTVKVEGRGNVASIEDPKAKWPEGIELYETKGRAKSTRGGIGEKIFEYLLIPRVPGKIELPALELVYFDPAKKEYVTKRTTPVPIQVLDPAPGSAIAAPKQKNPSQSADANASPGAGDDSKSEEIRPLRPPGDAGSSVFFGRPWWRWMYWLSVAGLCVFLGLVAYDRLRAAGSHRMARVARQRAAESKSWQKLQATAQAAAKGEASWNEVTQAYEFLCGAVYDLLDRGIGGVGGSRSLPRQELERMLVEERGIPRAAWERISRLLEYAEAVRFASSAGAVTEQAARLELGKWVQEAQWAEDALERSSQLKAISHQNLS